MDTIDLFGNASRPDHGSVLARTFEYPPFSVLSARDGWWQERKRQWLALGIKSELGRGGGATWNVGIQYDGPNVGRQPADYGKGPKLLPEQER